MRLSLFLSFVLALAVFSFTAAAEWSHEDATFVDETAKHWEIGAPNIRISAGNSAFADKKGGVTVGQGLIDHISSNFPHAAHKSTALRFIAAHELWHLRQFADGTTNESSTYSECEADVMAAYVVSTTILQRGGGVHGDAELRELLNTLATLRNVPISLSELQQGSSVERTGWHLSAHQRDIAIHFGLAWGGYDWGKAYHAATSSGLQKQYIEYTSRFVDPALPVRASAAKLCRHVARIDAEALGSLTVSALPSFIDNDTSKPRQRWVINVHNSSDRPIRYSFIGLSGYANGNINIYLDSSWNSVELAPRERRVVETSLLWPGTAASNASDMFTWMQPTEMDALVSAEYVGPPNVQSCARAMAGSLPQSEMVQALLRIGGAATERFSSLRRTSQRSNIRGLGSFELDISLKDATPEALVQSDGSAFATISFPVTNSLELARTNFNKLVDEIRTACISYLENTRVKFDDKGLPSFRVSHLTSRSSAVLYLNKTQWKNAPPEYRVIWLISPKFESGS